MKKSLAVCLLAASGLMSLAQTTHRWVIPWVANSQGQWASRIQINNTGATEATVNLHAVRADGTSQVVNGLTVAAGSSVALNAGETFADLGSGSGYAVFIESNQANLTGTVVVSNLESISGNSPAAGRAIPMSEASLAQLFTYTPASDNDISAVVIVNTSGFPANATIQVKSGSSNVATSDMTIPPNQPMALLASELAPGATGDLSVMVTADQPIAGANFVFNAAREPSLVSSVDMTTNVPNLEAPKNEDFQSHSPEKVALGKALFFDKILSGRQNISCATCHHPFAMTGDGLAFPVGEGGSGFGVARATGDIRERVPRNAPPVFNLGHSSFTSLFHDGRVETLADGTLRTPAGDKILDGLESTLAAQAMFPVTSRDEMRGLEGTSELGDVADGNEPEMWRLLVERLMAIDEYQAMFSAAYPDLTVPDDVTFAHAANAIAAFEADAWRADNSPFDRFLRGDANAMSDNAKRGMNLFYGRAGCGGCHTGVFQTDHLFHAVAVPQVGPGKGDGFESHDDFGRERVTGETFDRYKFRTPPLRNIALTAPYGHSGAYDTLEAMVRHMMNPVAGLENYDRSQLRVPSREDLDAKDFVVLDDADSRAALAAANEAAAVTLTDKEVADLVAFLNALTDPSSVDLREDVPTSVPSGLPLGD